MTMKSFFVVCDYNTAVTVSQNVLPFLWNNVRDMNSLLSVVCPNNSVEPIQKIRLCLSHKKEKHL